MSQLSEMSTDSNKSYDATPDVRMLESLRNAGYSNYSALADIIDNCFERGVNSNNVRIEIENNTDKDSKDTIPYRYIRIIDDGSGMTEQVWGKFLKLGADMGKVRDLNLGNYGLGLKLASISMGRRLEVFTSHKDYEGVFHLVFDLDEMFEDKKNGGDGWGAVTQEFQDSPRDIANFKRLTGGDSGTVVLIKKLDRITNSNITHFSNYLAKEIGYSFRRFMERNKKVITINGKTVKPVDPLLRSKKFSRMLTDTTQFFEYRGNTIQFDVSYLENTDEAKDFRTNRQAGLYIYRNNRLVGRGLSLGVVKKTGGSWFNSFRCEMFVSGKLDEVFGSTFQKVITEKDKSEIDPDFLKVLSKALEPYTEEVSKRETGVVDKRKKEKGAKKISEYFKLMNRNLDVQRPRIEGAEIVNFIDCSVENHSSNDPMFFLRKDVETGQVTVVINALHRMWEGYLEMSDHRAKGAFAVMLTSFAMSINLQGGFDEDGEATEATQKLIKDWSVWTGHLFQDI